MKQIGRCMHAVIRTMFLYIVVSENITDKELCIILYNKELRLFKNMQNLFNLRFRNNYI